MPTARTTILIYTLLSGLASLAGIVFSFYRSASATNRVELAAIAAVVIGGTLLDGGQGYVIGTFLGVLIQGLIQTYITFDGTLSRWWTKIAVGILLFGFIALRRALAMLSERAASGPAGKTAALLQSQGGAWCPHQAPGDPKIHEHGHAQQSETYFETTDLA